jgi:hypothetical protein
MFFWILENFRNWFDLVWSFYAKDTKDLRNQKRIKERKKKKEKRSFGPEQIQSSPVPKSWLSPPLSRNGNSFSLTFPDGWSPPDKPTPPVRSIINPWPFLLRDHRARSDSSPSPLDAERPPHLHPVTPHCPLSVSPPFPPRNSAPGNHNRPPELRPLLGYRWRICRVQRAPRPSSGLKLSPSLPCICSCPFPIQYRSESSTSSTPEAAAASSRPSASPGEAIDVADQTFKLFTLFCISSVTLLPSPIIGGSPSTTIRTPSPENQSPVSLPLSHLPHPFSVHPIGIPRQRLELEHWNGIAQ